MSDILFWSGVIGLAFVFPPILFIYAIIVAIVVYR